MEAHGCRKESIGCQQCDEGIANEAPGRANKMALPRIQMASDATQEDYKWRVKDTRRYLKSVFRVATEAQRAAKEDQRNVKSAGTV
jgi:hypothetical protein